MRKPEDETAGALRDEVHYDGRRMCCYAERPASLLAMFEGLVARFPDRPAIVEDATISYRALDALTRAIGANLSALGVVPGDRVALYLGNAWEFIAVLFACMRIGAIVVPIGVRQRHAELEFMLNDSGAKILIHEADLAAFIPSPSEIPGVAHRFSIRAAAPGARLFDELTRDGGACPSHAPQEEDVAVILYTSGTTGRSKGAQLTHLGIIHSALAFSRTFGLTEEDRAYVAVPLSHVTGFVGVAMAAMIGGGAVVLMRQAFKAADFIAQAAREKITFTIVVPAIYSLCALSPALDAHDLSAWRIGSFGGAPMPVPTIQTLAQKLPNLNLVNAYGATETTSPATIMPVPLWRENIDSVGRAVHCGTIRIVDDEGRDVAPGEPGEIWISGPMVVPGYLNRPDANASEFVDGFWKSGDIGSRDAQGFVRVFDRKKDMINRGGFKIFSAEVESVIAGIPGVVECAIVGRPDPVLTERVAAIVVVEEGASVKAEDVRAWCAERVSDYKTPEFVIVRTEPLPRNANGKILKPQLRKEME
ncbi:MAG TPA: class I adenylate-forming enzyme family protein [Rhodoblastus sp.]|nr:class I adenylate-forming enzyme family protein [Rhodoblastus sp.]